MALVLADRVREQSNTSGTGTITLSGAVTGYQTFSSAIGNGNTCYYTIANPGTTEWEVGIGTVGSGTLARTTIIASSNADAAVDFTAGTKDVFVTYPAEKSVYASNAPGTSGYILASGGAGVAPTWVAPSTIVSGAGGSNTQVQYNSSGALAGSSNLTFDGTTLTATGNAIISDNSTNAALRITQTGTGNALLVEDSSNPDSTPFVIDADGHVISGATAFDGNWFTSGNVPRVFSIDNSVNRGGFGSVNYNGSAGLTLFRASGGVIGTEGAVVSGNELGTITFAGSDGTGFIPSATISAWVDGTTGTNDMPGRLSFATTADGASSTTERMRIDNAGRIGIAGTAQADTRFHLLGALPSSSNNSKAQFLQYTIPSTTTGQSVGVLSFPSTQAAAFTLGQSMHFYANQGTIGAGSSITSQFGFYAESTLTGATNNYGFYGNIAAGTGRYNFYAQGNADNYFAGNTTIAGITTLGSTLQTGLGVSTGSAFIELGYLRTGDGNAYIDFHSQAGGDYQARIIKSGGANSSFFITNEGTGLLALNQVGAGAIILNTNGSERMRIDSSGNVLVGYTSSISSLGYAQGAQFYRTSGTIGQFRFSTDNGAPELVSSKARGSAGSATIVSSGDGLWLGRFAGYDGTNYVEGARISAEVDGTPGTNDMPGRLIFFTTADGASSPTERMRITSAGNVGVGTGSPSRKLSVYDTTSIPVRVETNTSDTKIEIITTSGTQYVQGSANNLLLGTNNTERMRIDSSGNVGIGTSSPTTKFQIYTQDGFRFDVAAGAKSYMRFGSAITGEGTAELSYTRSTGATAISVGATGSTLTDRLVIDNAGNVGIGTSSPGFKLDVRGTIAAYDGGTQITQISNAGEIELARTSGDAYIDFKTSTAEDYDCRIQQVSNGLTFQTGGNGSASERMRIDSSGNVGIGTSSPGYKFHVAGANAGGAVWGTFQNTDATANSTGGILVVASGTNNYASFYNAVGGTTYLQAAGAGALTLSTIQAVPMVFSTNSTERMRIDSSGNVGIGTSSPSAKLYTSTSSSTAYALMTQTPIVGLTAGNYVNMAYFGDSRTGNPVNDGLRIVNVRDSNGSGIGDWQTSSYRIRRSVDQTGGSGGVQEEIGFGATTLWFATADSERMRIDGSGNVGIGTNSPGAKLHVLDGMIRLSSAYQVQWFNGATQLGSILCDAGPNITFQTGSSNTERMRIDSSGNLLVGTTSAYANVTINNTASGSIGNALWLSNSSSVNGSGAALAFGNAGTLKHKIACGTYGSDYMSIQTWNGSAVTQRMKLDTDVTTYSTNFYVTTAGGNGMFKVMSGGGDIIQAYQNRDGTSPYFYFNTSGTYGVFSDSRLKDDIIPLDGADAVSFVMGLGPVEFNWREQYGDSTKRISGFLAQDALSAAVTEGQKNALTNWETYDENDPDCEFLGLSEQRILPSVVGALKVALSQIQELKAEVDSLKAQLNK